LGREEVLQLIREHLTLVQVKLRTINLVLLSEFNQMHLKLRFAQKEHKRVEMGEFLFGAQLSAP
jgi:hypothetical protein